MTTTTTRPRPSQAWVAKDYPIVDAPPEIQAAVNVYCAAWLRFDWARGNLTLREDFRAAEDALIRVFANFRGYYVCSQGLVQIVMRKTRPDYVELTPLSCLLCDRPRLEDR